MKNETQEIVTKFLQMKHDQAIAGKISSLSGLEVIMVEIFAEWLEENNLLRAPNQALKPDKPDRCHCTGWRVFNEQHRCIKCGGLDPAAA